MKIQERKIAYAKKLLEARRSTSQLPLASKHDLPMDESIAYETQGEYIRACLLSDKITGFKAALTNTNAQSMFGTDGAASGVLLESTHHDNYVKLSMTSFNLPVLEVEIGFRINQDIEASNKPLMLAEIRNYVGEILPMVEIPDLGFEARVATASDLIAANCAAAAFVKGKKNAKTSDEFDPNTCAVVLYKNDIEVCRGMGADALGDQWRALCFLMNSVLAQGYNIDKGSYMMTGALGGIVLADKGCYRAEYGDLGQVEFELV